jgi:hypothetical protein
MHHLLLLAMTFATLSAQNTPTWGGLSFGMTETQVRAILGSTMLKAGPGPDEQPADESSPLFIGGKVRVNDIKGFEGDASLDFDKTSKKLSLVTLFLKPLKDSSDENKSLAYKRLREDLLKKYGSPVERAGCSEEEITDPRTLSVECHLIFRSKGQTIDASMSSWHGGVPLLVYITYERTGAIKGI